MPHKLVLEGSERGVMLGFAVVLTLITLLVLQ